MSRSRNATLAVLAVGAVTIAALAAGEMRAAPKSATPQAQAAKAEAVPQRLHIGRLATPEEIAG